MKQNMRKFTDYSFKPLIEKTLDKLYGKEPELFNLYDTQKVGSHVGERAIMFRFGLYFQKELDECGGYSGYYLDCEYNRIGIDPKKLEDDLIIPDMILHRRGNNDGNLLVIEFKGWWNGNQKNDEEKIERMVNKNGEFQYREGYTVLLGKDRVGAKVNPILPKS